MSKTITNQDTTKLYEDLKGFLQSTRVDLRLEATKAVLQVVASDRKEALNMLQNGILLPLLRVVSDTSLLEDSNNATTTTAAAASSCSENALQSILYLSSSVEEITNLCVEELLQAKAVPRLVELVLSINPKNNSNNKSKSVIINYALAILANLTRTEQGAVELVGKMLPEEAVTKIDTETVSTKPSMELLLDRFLNREFITDTPDYASLEANKWDTLSHDPYQHFAAILMNATQTELGRRFVLKIPKSNDKNNNTNSGGQALSVFEILLPQLQNMNPIRRRGISGMIRNCCCLEQDSAWWMINVVKIITPLLYPLAGPEELDLDEKQGMDPDLWLAGPDKLREIDGPTRLHLVESILLLCATGRKSRDSLRLARTYVILKYADMVEELESISDRINECVQYLRRDEEGTAEGSSDRMVEEAATRNQLKLLPAAEVHAQDTDYDDVD